LLRLSLDESEKREKKNEWHQRWWW
jgi:hypothetical protein